MPTAPLQSSVPSRNRVLSRLLQAVAVAATLAILADSLWYAAGSAGVFLFLLLATDVAEVAVGDYANHVVFGLFALAFAGYAATLSTPLWFVAATTLLGGWFLLDGVQHLRHGETRDEVSVPFEHEGSAITGVARALVERLLAPIRLEM